MLAEYLKENNLTKYQFAKNAGLPYGTLNDICTGKTELTKCSGETLIKLADAIGCTVDELLREERVSAFDLGKIKNLIRPIAEKHRLRSVFVFGSYARGDADENSDVDLLIDREGSEIHGIFAIHALYQELKNALGKEIDLVTLQSLKQESTVKNNPDFVGSVMKERVKIYG